MAYWRMLSVTVLLVVAACTPAVAPPAPTAAPAPAPTLAATSGVRAAYTPPPPLSPPVHVKVIDGGIVSNISFYEGIDKGYFAAEGLDVELVTLQDVATSAQSIATNQVQFYGAVPDPVIFNALNRGVEIKLLVSSTTNSPTDRPAAFVVRKELIDSGRYKTPADL